MTVRRMRDAFPMRLSIDDEGFSCFEEFSIGIGKAMSVSGSLLKGRIGSILGSFDSDLFDSVAASLVKKHGKPSGTKTEIVQNRMGAKFTNDTLTWIFKDGSRMEMSRYSDTIAESDLYLVSKAALSAPRSSKEDDHLKGF